MQCNAGESVPGSAVSLSRASSRRCLPSFRLRRKAASGKLNLRSRVSAHRKQEASIHSQQYPHVDLPHSFRLRILHQDTARNRQAQRRPILQHHYRKKHQLLRTLTRRAEMEANTPSDEDALPPATAAQSACVESQ